MTETVNKHVFTATVHVYVVVPGASPMCCPSAWTHAVHVESVSRVCKKLPVKNADFTGCKMGTFTQCVCSSDPPVSLQVGYIALAILPCIVYALKK